MPAPTVHAHTGRLYDRLPEFYRDADANLAGAPGYPLLRFLSLIADQAGKVEDTLNRVDPAVGGDLTSADRADLAWLPWLAQVVGLVSFPANLTEAEKRNAIRHAANGRYAGTRQALADAARPALPNPAAGYVVIRPNYQGDPYTISVNVDPTNAPADLNTVLTTIIKAGAKPAGYLIVIDVYAATWAQLDTAYPTWAELDAVATWADVERTGA